MNVDVRVRVAVDAGARVYVSGDLPSWNARHPLAEIEPGLHCATVRAPPGVVRLRAFIEEGPGRRRWLDTRYLELRVDGAAVELRADDGESSGNTLVTLGGTRGSLAFAPDAAHVWCDGRTITVHAETHGEYGEPPRLELEGVAYALTKVARKGNVRQWRIAGVPIGAARDFRIAPDPTRFALEPLLQKRALPWLARANLYHVMVDRFRRGAQSPSRAHDPRTAPSTPETRYGGDLDGVRESLAALVDMGVTAVMLTPVHIAASAHGYDAVDLMCVDERYGGEAAFARLIEEAHARGVKVIVDFAVTHVHETHSSFLDVVERQGASDKRAWFRGLAARVDPRDPRTFAHYYDRPDLPLLDLDERRPARWHALEAARKWIDRGVDGLRLDAMADAPLSFWRDVRAVVGEAALIGEVVDDRPARFADVLDCVTDFSWRRRLLGELDEDAYRFGAHREGPAADAFRLRFVDNHDLPRVFSLRPREEARALVSSLCAHAGPIALTAGTELGLSGGAMDPTRAQRLDDVWPDRVPMPIGDDEPDPQLVRALRSRR